MRKLFQTIDNIADIPSNYTPAWLIQIMMRIAIFMVFWVSAQTKISGLTIPAIAFGDFVLIGQQHLAFWAVTESTTLLFEYEYGVPLLPPVLAAYMATIGEFVFSLCILFGFMTRISALAFLGMTAVIQLFVIPEAWVTHLLWAAILFILMKDGAGKISVDHLLLKKV